MKDSLLLIGKSSPSSGGSGFPLRISWLSGSLPYVQRHLTVNKKCVEVYERNKTFPSFLSSGQNVENEFVINKI